ncbi:MAG: hypothetical protein ABI823_12875 [Bryobacteraceae bacterium]
MSYADNMENALKNLEAREEVDPAEVRRKKLRDAAELAAEAKAAPYAEALKDGVFTQELLNHAVRIGFGHRAKVQITWLGTVLRLDAKQVRLELTPTPDGIVAHFSDDGTQVGTEKIDLTKANPEKLAEKWLKGLAAA